MISSEQAKSFLTNRYNQKPLWIFQKLYTDFIAVCLQDKRHDGKVETPQSYILWALQGRYG